MGLVLQLVKTGADTRGRGIDVLELDRLRDLRDIETVWKLGDYAASVQCSPEPGCWLEQLAEAGPERTVVDRTADLQQ